VESDDGINFKGASVVALDTDGTDEHRVGRPYVIREQGLYRMFYSAGTKSKVYRLAYADSPDGINWTRKDDEVGIDVSEAGWDSQMMAYPSVITTEAGTFLFYNGNDYGREGFGYAVLEQW
jgi:hypothetical protein